MSSGRYVTVSSACIRSKKFGNVFFMLCSLQGSSVFFSVLTISTPAVGSMAVYRSINSIQILGFSKQVTFFIFCPSWFIRNFGGSLWPSLSSNPIGKEVASFEREFSKPTQGCVSLNLLGHILYCNGYSQQIAHPHHPQDSTTVTYFQVSIDTNAVGI